MLYLLIVSFLIMQYNVSYIIKRCCMKKFTSEEDSILKKVWQDYTVNEIVEKFLPHRSDSGVRQRAVTLKLGEQSLEVKDRIKKLRQQLCIDRNKTLGRDRNDEWAIKEIKKYKSIQEVRIKDPSLYDYINKNNMKYLFDGMVVGDSFNYPQMFMYQCLLKLLPNTEILYNTRKIIAPYELDIYIPSKKLAIEYNGNNFHNQEDVKARDAIKQEKCLDMGITLYYLIEVNKHKPEQLIFDFLDTLGFDIIHLDVEELIQLTFNRKYSDNYIKEVVSKYTTLKEFRKAEPSLNNFLQRKGLLDKYTNKLIRRAAPELEDDAINELFLSCISAKEIREVYHNYFLRVYKDKGKYPIAWNTYLSKKLLTN